MPYGHRPFSREAYLTTDQLCGVASGTNLQIDCLSTAHGLSHVRQISHPGRWGFDSLDLAAHVRADGAMQEGLAAFIFVERSAGSSISGVPLKDNVVLSLPAGGEIRASMSGGTVYRGIVVPLAEWQAVQHRAVGFVREDQSGPSMMRLSGGTRPGLMQETIRLGDQLQATIVDSQNCEPADGLPRPIADCLSTLAELQARAATGYEAINRSVDTRLRQAWRAKDFILAHLGDDLSVDRLCSVVNVSRRQLEYAFRTTFNCSPYDFIQSVRLNEIRRQLQKSDGRTVTEIAMDNGVQHLGRFSSAYRTLFGELPKQTARSTIVARAHRG